MEVLLNSSLHKHEYWGRSNFNLSAVLPAYGIVLAICLTGNSVVCATILRSRNMKSRWYYLLFNLSVADMGFAITTPIQLVQFLDVNLGDFGCKCGLFVLDIFLGTALLSLAFISLDRYHGICKSFSSFGSEKVKARFIIPLIWIAAAVSYFPMTVVCKKSRQPGSLACDCHSSWPAPKYYTVYAFFITIIIYIVPFVTMLVCYTRICRKLWWGTDINSIIPADAVGSKKRSIKMLVATTLLFFLTWTPYNMLYMVKKLNLIDPKTLGKIFLASQICGFANSAVNPFVYCIFSKSFRAGFKNIFACRKRRHQDSSFNTQKPFKDTNNDSKRNETRTSSDTGYGSISILKEIE
eukprot:gene1086-15419_t